MEKFKRWLSTKAYKKIKTFIFFFIVLFNIFVVFIGGLLIHVAAPKSFASVGAGMWQIFTDVLDPGFLSSSSATSGGGTTFTKSIEIVVILVCMVTFTGAIIGYISNLITSIIENSVSGPKRMYLKNHILILNWNNRAAGIISEYLYTEICEDVVILTTEDPAKVTKEIEDDIYECGYSKNQKHVNFVVKQGEPFSYSELDAICVKQARTIIVLSDKNPNDGDLRTLKTVMMVSQMNSGRDDCTIVVETDNQNIYELVDRIKENNSNKIISAYLNKLLGKLLAHTALQPELNVVFAELFSHCGNEIYHIPIEDVNGLNLSMDENEIIDNFFKSYNKAIPLITSKSFEKDTEQNIFVLSDKKSSVLSKRENKLEAAPVALKKDFVIPKKIIVLLGSNSKMRYIINSFKAYISNYGEDKLKVYLVDTKDRLCNIPEHPCFEKIYIADRYNIMEIRRVIAQFDLRTVDTIAILSDDMVSSAEYDSGALISLIDINKEVDKIEKENRPEIIVEILNPKNHEIVQQYNIDNVIVSNKYISSMVAQLGDDSSIYEFIYDILTFDNELDDFDIEYSANKDSKELYIKRCGDYFEEIPRFSSISQLIYSIYESSNKTQIPIGIIYADESKNHNESEILEKTYTFSSETNFDESGPIELCEDDKIVIFSSDF